MESWNPSSWQHYTDHQQIIYPSTTDLTNSIARLSQFPPLVTNFEIDSLRAHLANAAQGKSFILQGGDCAESFIHCNTTTITNQIKILLQMSLILVHGLRKPIIRIGRIAGQYAKPRSSMTETRENITLPSYRGDIINGIEFTKKERTPDPELMIQGYNHAAITLNFVRALIESGFADLQHPEFWDIDFVKHSPLAEQYRNLVNTIRNSLAFLKTIDGIKSTNLTRVNFYTSHEALLLPYEQAFTRQNCNGRWYNLSTHFPWVGARTCTHNSAHIEYIRGIANPVAVKIHPNVDTDWIQTLVKTLNPENELGRLTLITRMGAKGVTTFLPPVIEAVAQTNRHVLWMCDPMHGNTHTTANGMKTRHFNEILAELEQTFQLHQQMGSQLNGIHFELTGENVTECIGGARGLTQDDLPRAYKTRVDPRLNYEQALEMALLIAHNARVKQPISLT